MKKLLLVDDHEIIRSGIRYYFEDHLGFSVKAEASDGVEALEELEKESYDVMLTDISMPNMDGTDLIREARKRYPELKIIALTMHGEAHIIKQVLKEQVNGFILKNSGKEELIKGIETVLGGEDYFDERAMRSLISDIAKKPQKKDRLVLDIKLSSRELEVLKLIAGEYSNREIADKLFISIRTVETHKRNLIEKTGAKNVAGLVMYAVERNLIHDT